MHGYPQPHVHEQDSPHVAFHHGQKLDVSGKQLNYLVNESVT